MILLIVLSSGCGAFEIKATIYSKECAGVFVKTGPSKELKEEIRARGGLTEEEKKFYNSIADNNNNLDTHCP